MKYVIGRCALYDREDAYRVYVAKGVEVMARLNMSYTSLFKPVETRSADEIIDSISKGLDALGGA